MTRDTETLANDLTQVITDALTEELDVLTATDDKIYNKIVELTKLCSEKFYSEEHLDEAITEFEYRDMDEFPAEE